MAARSAVASTVVDVDAIALAVAAAVPDIDDIETQAEAGAAAAITAAGLPNAAAIDTVIEDIVHGDGSRVLGNIWRSSVGAIEDTRAATVAAIADAVPTLAEIGTEVDDAVPDVTMVVTSPINGDAEVVAVAGVPGQVIKVFGLESAGSVSGPEIWSDPSASGTQLGGPYDYGYQWPPGRVPLYQTVDGEDLVVRNPNFGSDGMVVRVYYIQE